MRLKIFGMCRGSGKAYIKLDIEGPLSGCNIELSAKLSTGKKIPSNLYLLEHDEAIKKSARCVAVIPLLEVDEVILNIDIVDGDAVTIRETLTYQVKMNQLKWRSRFAYRFTPELIEEIRGIDEQFTYGQIVPIVRQSIPDGEERILQVKFTMPYNKESEISIKAMDARGEKLNTEIIPMGDMLIHPERVEDVMKKEIVISMRLPRLMPNFCVYAEDMNGYVNEGFLCLEQSYYDVLSNDYWKMIRPASEDPDYQEWFDLHKVSIADLRAQRQKQFDYEPLISIVVPLYNTPISYFLEMLDSVMQQSYQNWELVLVNASDKKEELSVTLGAITDSRVRVITLEENRGIVANTNVGIQEAHGEFVAFLDHDDIIEPDAVFEYVRAMNAHADCDLLYCDEDSINESGLHVNAHFKSDFNLDLLYSHNYITHFLMIRKALIEEVGMSPEYVNGAQDYDLTLRSVEKARRVHHISKVLYHWRIHAQSTSVNADSKPYAHEAGKRALTDHFNRIGVDAEVLDSGAPFVYKQSYNLTACPLVSVIIPNKDQIALLDACIQSLLEKATYTNFEIIVVENNSEESETFSYYDQMCATSEKIKVIHYDEEFNYSKIINYGVEKSQGEYLLLLNNDTELISPDIFETMLGYFTRPEVGIVGAKLLYRDRTVQHAGVVVGPFGLAAHLNGGIPENAEGYFGRANRPQNLSAITGACQMVSREVFNEVNCYDEAYTVGFNDVDFCLKIREAGYLVVYTPYAKLFHYEFSSRGRDEHIVKRIRSEKEKAILHYRWTDYFIIGDPYYNKNLDRDGLYFGLGDKDYWSK
jgi:GT2 family glycosyltransferase